MLLALVKKGIMKMKKLQNNTVKLVFLNVEPVKMEMFAVLV